MTKNVFHLKKLPLLISSAAALACSSVALGQEAESAWMGLEEIVVTAQFREQNVQDTPIAITAMSAATLEARGQVSIENIAGQAPNVSLTTGGSFGGNSLTAFIRGVGQTDFNPAIEPGVGLYVDDVYYATMTGSVLDLLDLERVEVLRGPQGTLAGKNSIGGSIKLFSQRPDEEANGYVEVTAGMLDLLSVRAASNFTLVDDKLYARVSGVSKSRGGHVDVIDWACSHPDNTLGFGTNFNGNDCTTGTEGGVNYTAGRLALRWLASDDLEVNFALDRTVENSDPPANILRAVYPATTRRAGITPDGSEYPAVFAVAGLSPPGSGPGFGNTDFSFDPDGPGPAPLVTIPFGPVLDPSIFLAGEYQNYSSYGNYQTGNYAKREMTLKSTGASINADWSINEDLQLQSITSYREYTSGWGNDTDATPLSLVNLYQTLIHDAWSQEFRLNGGFGENLDYTVGAFYHDSTTTMTGRIDLGYVDFDFVHGPDPVDTTTQAIFLNVTYRLTDSLELISGLRYSEDEKVYQFVRREPDLSAIIPCGPGASINCLISDVNGTTSVFKGDRTDWRVALNYMLNEDVIVYGQVATGYKGGGVNPRPFFNDQAQEVEPEELISYEIGAKADLLDNTLRINAAIFYNEYTDIQFQLGNCTGVPGVINGIPCLMTTNAADGETTGVELEFDYSPNEALSIDGSVSYINFDLTKLLYDIDSISKDNVSPFTPEVTASLGIQYRIGSFVPRIDFVYQDDVYAEWTNAPDTLMKARTLVNARIAYEAGDDWLVAMEVQNLTDKYYFTQMGDGASGSATSFGQPGLPRTVNFTVKRKF